MISCKGAHVPQDILRTGVRWYVAYPLRDRHVEGFGRAFDLGGHAGVLASLSMSLPPPQGMPRGARLGRGAIRVRVSASSALILRSPPGQFPLDNPAD